MITCAAISQAVAQHYGLTVPSMYAPNRLKQKVWARHLAWYLARQLTPYSFPEIAKRMGNRDHSTVQHGIWTAEERIGRHPDYRADSEKISAALVEVEALEPGSDVSELGAEAIKQLHNSYRDLHRNAVAVARRASTYDRALGNPIAERQARRDLDRAIFDLRNHLSKENRNV